MSAKLVIGRGPSARTIVFDREEAELGRGGTALVLKGVLPREDGSGGDKVAFKIAWLQPDADDDEFGEDSESDDSSEEDSEEEDDRRKEESREEESESEETRIAAGAQAAAASESVPGEGGAGQGEGGDGEGRAEEVIDAAMVAKSLGVEAGRMRQFGGQPPFVKLYAAEVDRESPATYTDTRGDAIPALCIAMQLVPGELACTTRTYAHMPDVLISPCVSD